MTNTINTGTGVGFQEIMKDFLKESKNHPNNFLVVEYRNKAGKISEKRIRPVEGSFTPRGFRVRYEQGGRIHARTFPFLWEGLITIRDPLTKDFEKSLKEEEDQKERRKASLKLAWAKKAKVKDLPAPKVEETIQDENTTVKVEVFQAVETKGGRENTLVLLDRMELKSALERAFLMSLSDCGISARITIEGEERWIQFTN